MEFLTVVGHKPCPTLPIKLGYMRKEIILRTFSLKHFISENITNRLNIEQLNK
jgi:hypothetical protein